MAAEPYNTIRFSPASRMRVIIGEHSPIVKGPENWVMYRQAIREALEAMRGQVDRYLEDWRLWGAP